MAYLITYDLSAPGQDYDQLEAAIESLGSAIHIASSTWILDHPGSSIDIRDYLLDYIDENDKLVVIKCSRDMAWHGIKPAWEAWLQLTV